MALTTRSPALPRPNLSSSVTQEDHMDFVYTDVCSQETLFPFPVGFAEHWMATNQQSWHFSRIVCIFSTLHKKVTSSLIKIRAVTLSSAPELAFTGPVSDRSSSRLSMAIPDGTGPFDAVVALEDLRPRHQQNLGQVVLRGSWPTCSRSWM